MTCFHALCACMLICLAFSHSCMLMYLAFLHTWLCMSLCPSTYTGFSCLEWCQRHALVYSWTMLYCGDNCFASATFLSPPLDLLYFISKDKTLTNHNWWENYMWWVKLCSNEWNKIYISQPDQADMWQRDAKNKEATLT